MKYLLAFLAVTTLLPAAAQESAREAPILIEIESLVRTVQASAGDVSVQDMRSFGPNWSGNAHLFWRAPAPGRNGENAARLTLSFDVREAGTYTVLLYTTQAPDYGDARIRVNGGEPREIVGFSPAVRRIRSSLGVKVPLKAGPNEMEVQLFRKMSASKGAFFGLDSLELRKASVRDATQGPAQNEVQTENVAQGDVTLGPSGTLSFPTYAIDSNKPKTGAFEVDSYKAASSEMAKLFLDSPHYSAFQWRWQVSNRPFTKVSTLTPPQLLGDGDLKSFVFDIDLRKLAAKVEVATGEYGSGNSGPITQNPQPGGANKNKKTSKYAAHQPRPFNLYIRVIPLKNGKPAGPPSNTVVAHMKLGKSPGQLQAETAVASISEADARKKEVNGYKIDILDVKLALFERGSQWGCVIVDANPYVNVPAHPLAGKKVGSKVCPRKDPDKMEKGVGDTIIMALEGWLIAYDKAAGFFTDIKEAIAEQVASALPCEALGDAADDCEKFAKIAAHAAMNYGLAALGVPPTLPSVAQLQDAAEGKVVDSAAKFTCDQMKSQGQECTPEMEANLRKLYQGFIDKVQKDLAKQAQEPHCGDTKTAKELGRLPPLCFSNYAGAKVHPAPESIYEPPVVKVKVTRVKPPPSFHPLCMLTLSFQAKNHWPGGNVPGIASPPVPEKDISGDLYEPEIQPLPVLAMGQSIDLTLTFKKIRMFKLVGGSDPGTYTEWAFLYRGGQGTVRAATDSRDPQILKYSGGQTPVACSNPDSVSMSLVKQK